MSTEHALSTAAVSHAPLAFVALSPLLGSALAFLVGLKKRDAAGWIATAASALSFLWVLKLVYSLPVGGVFEDRLFTWFAVGGVTVDFLFRFDQLTAVMCLVVTGIGSLIHLYSTAYMHEDECRHRFFAYLNLFMFSMLMLVLGGNLLMLFVGWEGVGLCSYLLIGFWFKNEAYARAGRKAFVVNRIGDAGFLLAIFLLVQHFGTVDFVELQAAVTSAIGSISLNILLTTVAICLFIGACGKSAQIPLFVWLPDAMAGPTPVSALIHAATMVTAGVYMMARTHFIFDGSPYAQAIVIFIAVATAFVAATTALTQWDIKKVLAYSTVSQLGFMFIAAGSGAYWVAIFHVMTHAFFKACLFLGAGSVIHGCHHEQDMRHMGGLRTKMPITFWTYLISVLAIAGIAPLSGYYSKHAITAALSANQNSFLMGWIEPLSLLVTFTAFLTAFYMTRSLALTFFGKYHGHAHPHESPLAMTLPLMVLALLALVGGVLWGEPLYSYLHHVLPDNGAHFHHESIVAALTHSWVGFLGVGLAMFFYTSARQVPAAIYKALLPLGKLSSGKWYFDEIYAAMLVRPLQGLAQLLFKRVDQGVVDASVNGVAALTDLSGELTRTFQGGQVRQYAVMMLWGAVLIIGLYLVM